MRLFCRSAAAFISDVLIQTSVRDWRLALDVELSGVDQNATIQFAADVLRSNTLVRSFAWTTNAARSANRQVFAMAWP